MDGVILCVDDEEMILTALEMQLDQMFGSRFAYEFAESAQEACALMDQYEGRECQIIVIITDWLMPGIKGDVFLVKAHQRFPKVVKIMLTGQADQSAIQNAKENAALHRCLTKPWLPEDLREAIESGLAQGRAS